jgi:NAD(P)-dependent dehydrogenase (short-subunit alcohol dehydrogenase family)
VTDLLQGRVAIVSGIGPGMGRDVSLALAREGADLVLAARTASKISEVAAEVRAAGRRALEVPTDITSAPDCKRLAHRAMAEFGRIDVLVNNAFDMGSFIRMEDARAEDFLRPLRVNLIGSLQLLAALLQQAAVTASDITLLACGILSVILRVWFTEQRIA